MPEKIVLVSVDLEGVTGVVHPLQASPGERDYDRFRTLMMRETNAVVQGAYSGGADKVVVNDSHDGMLNLRIEDLDPRAELISGVNKPFSMMQGVASGQWCAIYIGYHSMASGLGVLSHTMTTLVSRAWLNGEPASEGVINAMIAGSNNVPVGMIAGDQYAVSELRKVCPWVRGVVVKDALDRYAAHNRPFTEVERELQETARVVVAEPASLKPFKPAPPVKLRVEFAQPSMASKVSYLRGSRRLDARTVEFEDDDPIRVWLDFYSSLSLAESARQQLYG